MRNKEVNRVEFIGKRKGTNQPFHYRVQCVAEWDTYEVLIKLEEQFEVQEILS